MNKLYHSRDLPLYKDKPYFQPRRTPRGAGRTWRTVLIAVAGFITITILYASWGSSGSQSPIREWPDGDLGEELYRWMLSLEDNDKGKQTQAADWEERRQRVRDVFIVSWDNYEKYGWGYDEFKPIEKTGRQSAEDSMPGGMIVGALDTAMLMNLSSCVQSARRWIQNSLRFDQLHRVSTSEAATRILGGLLSAHYLSTTHPDLAPIRDDDPGAPGEDLYIEKATDLANQLLGAFDTPSGVPYPSVNLATAEGIPSAESLIAEAASLQLEFKYLARLTGEHEYWEVVEHVMKVVSDAQQQDGLLPMYISPATGAYREKSIRWSKSWANSYYESLIKQYLQTSEQEPVYNDMWQEALRDIRKHLIAHSRKARLTVLGERPIALTEALLPKMDHRVCFLPGTIALAATKGVPLAEARKSPEWTTEKEEDMALAQELMKTCWAMYLATETKLAPETTYFHVDDNEQSGEIGPTASQPFEEADTSWKDDVDIHPEDVHNLQRPEAVESLLYLYRITGDEMYRDWGWQMFTAFVKHTAVVEQPPLKRTARGKVVGFSEMPSRIVGFSSLANANTLPPVPRDSMEVCWMAETLKYFYLLFSDREFLPLEETVFNAVAHPFPRFELKGDLKTGWEREPR